MLPKVRPKHDPELATRTDLLPHNEVKVGGTRTEGERNDELGGFHGVFTFRSRLFGEESEQLAG